MLSNDASIFLFNTNSSKSNTILKSLVVENIKHVLKDEIFLYQKFQGSSNSEFNGSKVGICSKLYMR